jgi:hypothetical protein
MKANSNAVPESTKYATNYLQRWSGWEARQEQELSPHLLPALSPLRRLYSHH